jgi:hypothetical protein
LRSSLDREKGEVDIEVLDRGGLDGEGVDSEGEIEGKY